MLTKKRVVITKKKMVDAQGRILSNPGDKLEVKFRDFLNKFLYVSNGKDVWCVQPKEVR